MNWIISNVKTIVEVAIIVGGLILTGNILNYKVSQHDATLSKHEQSISGMESKLSAIDERTKNTLDTVKDIQRVLYNKR